MEERVRQVIRLLVLVWKLSIFYYGLWSLISLFTSGPLVYIVLILLSVLTTVGEKEGGR